MYNQRLTIAIIGATGMIGKSVCAHLSPAHELVVFRRMSRKNLTPAQNGTFFYSTPDELTRLLAGTECDVIINLAGEPIAGKRWSEEQKRKIGDSRILTTRAVVEAVRQMRKKPLTLINASAIGFYGETGERTVDENSPPGNGFLSRVCAEWENEALKARQEGVRVVLLRLGIVLGNGGALAKLKIPFQWFAGGPVGNGRQWLSWIHIDDVSMISEMSLLNEDIQGPINCVSPEPMRMSDFAKTLGKTIHRPCFLRAPAWVIRALLGESASLLLLSQKVIPAKLEILSFQFHFRKADAAMADLLVRQRY